MPTGDAGNRRGRQFEAAFWLMRLCREQTRSRAHMGSRLALAARASRLGYAGTIGHRARVIDRGEDLSLRIIHLQSVLASTPQKSPVRVASQNCRLSPIPNPSLGLRPNLITSEAAIGSGRE